MEAESDSDEGMEVVVAGLADTVLKFGKHKGDSFEEVRLQDPGYCRWVKELEGCDGQMLEFQEYLEPYFFSTSFRRMRRRASSAVAAPTPAPTAAVGPRKPVKGPDYTEVKQDKEAEEGEATCVVCLTNKRNCVTQPCMHLHYCVGCARALVFGRTGMELKYRGEVKCPDCRTEVKAIQRVHM